MNSKPAHIQSEYLPAAEQAWESYRNHMANRGTKLAPWERLDGELKHDAIRRAYEIFRFHDWGNWKAPDFDSDLDRSFWEGAVRGLVGLGVLEPKLLGKLELA